jgi:glycosyltransferase involved in cell wall biosynthesis
MKRSRILHLFVSLPVGGAENLLISILRKIDSGCYDSVVCTLGKRGFLADVVASMGIPLIELGLFDSGHARARVKHALVELMRRERIDLLHSHLYHANYIGRLAAKKLGIPCVVSIQNTYNNPKLHRRMLNWWLSRRHTAAIIAGSGQIREDIIRYDHVRPELVEVIPNSVDLSRSESSLNHKDARVRLGLDGNAFILGTIGRLEEQKGHRFLLDSMNQLRSQGLNVVLLLIGAGREELALKEQAKRLNLDDSVRFLGMRDDLGDLFKAMDLFVMPSLWEGLSLAMLSAMAAGLAVVSTDVGGVREVLGENERGFVVQPRDSDCLAAQIQWCYLHPEVSSKVAKSGSNYVRENYSDNAMVGRLESIYQRILESKFDN